MWRERDKKMSLTALAAGALSALVLAAGCAPEGPGGDLLLGMTAGVSPFLLLVIGAALWPLRRQR